MSPLTLPTAPSIPAAPSVPITLPALMTAEEFAAKYAHIYAELVKGVVKEYPVPWFKHGYICSRLAYLLTKHVESNDLGRVATNDSWIRTGSNPDTVRGADVYYFSFERLPKGPIPDGLLEVAPELVVEVRSPSDL